MSRAASVGIQVTCGLCSRHFTVDAYVEGVSVRVHAPPVISGRAAKPRASVWIDGAVACPDTWKLRNGQLVCGNH